MNHPAPQPSKPSGAAGLFWILLLVTSVPRLGSSFYLPALPVMEADLGTGPGVMALTLTLFFAGFAIATLIAGPIVDAHGRRGVIRWGLAVFALGSLLTGMAWEPNLLLTGRILQAIGAAFIPVSARVMIRDAFDDRQVLNILGWLGTLGSLIPMLAPTLGGFIVEYADWRATFLIMFTVAVLTLLTTWRRVPETLSERTPLHLPDILRGYGTMLRSGSFMLVILPLTCCFAIQGIYFAAAPFIFIRHFAFTPSEFGLANLCLVIALIAGRACAVRLAHTHSLYAIYLANSALVLVSGALMFGLVQTGAVNAFNWLAAAMLYAFGFGGMAPVGMKSVLTAWRQTGGKASALMGTLTFGAIGLGSALIGALADQPGDPLFTMALLTLGLGLLTATFAAMTGKELI